MANKTLNVRIQNKYDTEANWASKNPVLLKGEAAYSSDKNGLYKIGDGTSKWSDLKYGLSSELDALTNNKSDFKFSHHVTEYTGTAYYTKLFELTADSTHINYNYEFAIAERNGGIAYVHIYLYSDNNKYFTDALIRYKTDSGYADFITGNMKGFVYKDTTKQYSKLEVWFKVDAWQDVRIMEKTVSDRGCKFTWASNFTRNAAFPTDATSIVEPKPQTVAWGNITGKPSTYYTHPSYTARSSGLYKVTVDAMGHVSGATAVSKADITALGIPGTDTNTWRGVQNNLTSTATDQSLSAAQGKILNETKTTRHDWNTIIKCATWSRLCYVPYSKTVVGSSFLLNIRGTRGNVVYNDTFMIKAHHPSKGNIVKISGCNYSIVSIRIVCDSSGNCYVEFFDSANGATNATTQTVYCTLIEVAVGSITKYTSFTNGTTLPANFTVAATLTTNTNSLQGNLTWDEITGKPTTFTPSSHTHDDRYYTESEINSKLATYLPLAGGSMTGNIKFNTKWNNYIGEGNTNNASEVGGDLNNLVIASWWGVSFTTPCAYQKYTNKTAVGIDCRNGIVKAAEFRGTFTGNASTASKWATARTLTLTGSVTGSVSIDGSGNVSLATTTNHTHSQYYDSGISRAANTVLAAPNGANGTATFRKLVAADIPTLTKSKISDFPTSLDPTAGSNNYVRVYNSSNIGNSNTVTFNDLAKQHFAMGMINGATDNPYGAAKWAHGISMAWANGANTSWISQIALGVQEGTGMWYRTKPGTIVGADWTRVLDSSNYTSYAATKGHTHSSIKDIGNGTDTTFAYSKAGMNYADYTWLAAWNGNELRAVAKSQFATAGHGHNTVELPRVTKDANGTAQKNIFKVEEFSNGTTYNLPSNAWYHIMTNQGADTNYATQLALGMTTQNIAYRIRNGSSTTWGSWLTVLTSSNYSTYAAPKSHSHNYITSSGVNNNLVIASKNAGTSGAIGLAPAAGVAMYEYYSSTTGPTTYGNLLTVRGDSHPGATQIALPWNGTTNTAPYIRTHSDWANTHTWSDWKQLCFTDGSGATGTWAINVTGSAGSVAWGNVSGRPSSMPASDVYAWAKAASKPSYSWGEITGKPGAFNPSSHNHRDLDAIGSVGYYGSDVANSNGWYKVYSTTLTGYNDHVARLSIVSGYNPYASGLLILHLRCNNTTSLNVQQLIWETRQGFNADDVIINTNGNTWTLYLKITNTQYGRVKIRVLESTSTVNNWSISLSNNNTKESTNPKATATAKDGAIVNYANSAGSVAWSGISGKPSTYTPSSHTHNYAGSSSAGGAATSANKLNTNAGSATQPVYFSGGVPVACTYTLGKSVPADAKFTDTVYTHPNSGVTAGTYRSVTVNAQGHVTSGSNPTTLAGYGITDAAAKTHTHNYAGSSSAGGSANSAVKLATARNIALSGLSSGSANFDGSGNIIIENWGYGCKKYVTTSSSDKPYFRIAYYNTTNNYVDASMVFVIDSGCNGNGFGIVKVSFRSNNVSTVNQSYCEIKWLVREGFAADQIFVKGYAPAGGTQYADLYFKATGTYQGIAITVLSTGSRGSKAKTWTFEEGDSRASADIRAYGYTTNGSDSGTVSYSNSTGSASTSTKLTTARNIFGKSFNGTADVAGQGLFYGTYTSTASNRFSNSGLQIRENGLVGKNQTDIGYAPTIGFHWSSRIAATLAFGSDGIFYFRKQNGTDRATIDANVNGAVLKLQTFKKGSTTETYGTQYPVYAQWEDDKNVLLKCDGYTVKTTYANSAGSATSAVKLDTSTAGSATQPVYFTGGKPVACTYTLGKSVPSNAVFTDTNNKMTQTAIASKDYTNWRTILWGASNSGTEGFTPTTVTDGAFTDTNLSYQPSTGTLRAKVFKGALSANTTIGSTSGLETTLEFTAGEPKGTSAITQTYYLMNDFKTDYVFGVKNKSKAWISYYFGDQVYFKNSSADISALAGKMLPPVLTDFSGNKNNPGAGTGRVLSIASNVDAKIIKFRIFTSSTATTATTVNVTYSTSDIRLKDNVKDTDIKDALSVINKMKIRQFDWKDDNKHQKIGFVADELEELDDKLVVGGGWEDEEHTQMNVKGVDTFYMMGYVVKGMQELSEQIKALTEENKELKKQIEGLKREG